MKKQIPAMILAITSIALAVALYSAKQEIAQLQQQIDAQPTVQVAEESPEPVQEIKDASELVKREMKPFLNNDEDYAEFEFFEHTQGERMMLSQAENNQRRCSLKKRTISSGASRGNRCPPGQISVTNGFSAG